MTSDIRVLEIEYETPPVAGETIQFDGENWVPFPLDFVGSIRSSFHASAPAGYLALAGGTIGDASSSATFAGADYEDLFTHLWNNLANTEAPVSTGRGASAAADFAAHKRLTLPDMRQRFPIGKSAAGTGSTLGGTGGTVDHTHTVPAHHHAMGTGADLNITASGSHHHTATIETIAGGGNFRYQGAGNNASGSTGFGNQDDATHTHASGSFAGKIGLVTGGVDGNAQMTSGTNNPPFLTLNYWIKY